MSHLHVVDGGVDDTDPREMTIQKAHSNLRRIRAELQTYMGRHAPEGLDDDPLTMPANPDPDIVQRYKDAIVHAEEVVCQVRFRDSKRKLQEKKK